MRKKAIPTFSFSMTSTFDVVISLVSDIILELYLKFLCLSEFEYIERVTESQVNISKSTCFCFWTVFSDMCRNDRGSSCFWF